MVAHHCISHGQKKACCLILRTLIHHGVSTLMTSSKPNYPIEAPIPKTILSGVRVSTTYKLQGMVGIGVHTEVHNRNEKSYQWTIYKTSYTLSPGLGFIYYSNILRSGIASNCKFFSIDSRLFKNKCLFPWSNMWLMFKPIKQQINRIVLGAGGTEDTRCWEKVYDFFSGKK